MHGITRFDTADEIGALLRGAGLPDHRIGAAVMRRTPERIAENLGWRPLRVVQEVLRRFRAGAGSPGEGEPPPQTFDRTQFFRNRRLWQRLSPVVNLYWFGVLRLVEAAGPAFDVDWQFRSVPFADSRIVIVGTAPQAERRTQAPAVSPAAARISA
jgi:hypothetical protein